MATLSTKVRKTLPKAQFGLPGSRRYPMPDARHAALAKARATQEVARGNLSPSSKGKIDAAANKVLARARSKRGR